ncbi:hypothetical protein IDSA_05175 [Pseudidiomarina salinarum]|uniref:STAS/SEC14 domain-containing protein n=1 Tax=Pseudidiomarina salinarum TaxID=435908 RepID=A0A094JHP1_9GAMM|nr:STAS/SEC14 domain-containing protein [Pseudidiomarina salinarum]KFZ32066.1 hypothetical protein IDSA_05175 [Pseudidiomarina salinarum]RUO70155.1 STAS/SEC14 domain-containing protein [Pseudidiomarina salinarum]
MLNINLLDTDAIAVLEPKGKLSEADFKFASDVIDPYVEKSGGLKGIIIRSKEFPGWDSFSALSEQVNFVKDHHKKISHVAVVTDSSLAGLAEKVGGGLVDAEIKTFSYGELEQAKSWILAAHGE